MCRLGTIALLFTAVSSNIFAKDIFIDNILRKEIYKTVGAKAIYSDMLGEGEGHFDSGPRYLPNIYNCTTWFQSVIARAYALKNPQWSTLQIMDELRYYGGVINFSTRKHFQDHWLKYDSGPMEEVVDLPCTYQAYTVTLNFEKLKQHYQFNCPLYGEKENNIQDLFIPSDEFKSCLNKIPPNLYIVFPIAGPIYQQKFGDGLSMAKVHGFILDVTLKKGKRTNKVTHASITAGKVLTGDAETYLKPLSKNFYWGYTIYKFNPTWSPAVNAKKWGNEIKQLQENYGPCENKLKPSQTGDQAF